MTVTPPLIILTVLMVVSGGLAAQQTQPFFRQITTKDGLPSSETYCALQDREGYMWFGTDNGVARYDGYEFKVYGIDDGLTDVVVFNIVEDDQGKLWAGTYSGRVFYLENDRFYPHQHNDRLVGLKSGANTINLFRVNEDGSMLFKVSQISFYSMDADGSISQLSPVNKHESFLVSSFESADRAAVQYGVYNYSFLSKEKGNFNLTFYAQKEKQWSKLGTLKLDLDAINSNSKSYNRPNFAYRPGDSLELLTILENTYSYFYGNETYVIPQSDGYPQMVMTHKEKGFLVGMGRGEGLKHYYLDQEGAKSVLKTDTTLQGFSISYAYYDNDGGLWVCSNDQGIFYSSNPNLNTYHDLRTINGSKPISIQLIDEHSYYAGYENREMRYRDTEHHLDVSFSIPYIIARSINSIAYSPDNKRVYTSLGSFVHPSDLNKLKSFNENSFEANYVGGYILNQPYVAPNYFNYAAVNRVGRYDLLTGKPDLSYLMPIEPFRVTAQSFGVHYDGRLLVGTMEGVYVLEKADSLIKDDLGIPELNTRIISINNLINGGTLFGTRGQGLVFIGEKGQNVITTESGLASNIIRRVHQSENGDIWIATLSGLTKLRLSINGKIEEIRSFGLEHGLASKEVHDIDSYENEVWLATGEGVVHFQEPPLDTTSEKPFINWIQIDGQQFSTDSALVFAAGQHDLKIAFSAFNYRMLGNIPFRYRLNQDRDWQYTKNRLTDYPNLSPNSYRFEVQCQNQDGYWSDSAVLVLNIPALWYNRWPVRIVSLFLLVGLIAGIFALRESNHRQEQAIAQQIDELERAAKQAQMNPHFIFNSLNSIQYFILNNDVKQAVYYLSRFANLIRQTLRSSVSGVHTLREEVTMLETYLSLEKLRYKDSFDYQIVVEDHLSQENIRFSPLLVQPFVENALLHGLADFDAGGELNIAFAGTTQELIVVIQDNGSGFDPQQQIAKDSMGMKITSKRLQLYKNKKLPNKQRMKVEPLYDQNDLPIGTRVTLRVFTR